MGVPWPVASAPVILTGASYSQLCDPQTLPGRDFLGIKLTRKPAKCLTGLVGAAGFEPTTPSPPDWCANRAAPRPDRQNDYNLRTSGSQ
jgi:hypothetical protein